MEIFYTKCKLDLMTLVDNFGSTRVTKKCLLYIFGFQHGSIHVSKDDVYDGNRLPKLQYTRSLFQILMGSIGMSRQRSIRLLVTTLYSVLKA